MTCDEYRELISAAMDGEADEEQLRALNAHLSECEECSEYAAELREISELLRSDLPVPDEDFTASVMDRIRAESDAKQKKNKLVRMPRRYLTLAASLLVVVGLGMLAKRTFSPKGAAAVETEAASLDMAESPLMMAAAAAPEGCEEETVMEEALPEEPRESVSNNMMLFAAPAERKEAAAGDSVANAGGAPAPAAFYPGSAADEWLFDNIAAAEEYIPHSPAFTNTPGSYEPLEEINAPAQCWAVSYSAPGGGTLTLLVDEHGTVFGLVRE